MIWTGVAIVTLGGASTASAAPQQPSAVERKLTIPPDYPTIDDRIWALEQTGLTQKLAREALTAAPDSVETFDLLIRARRFDDALDVLKRIADRRPREIEAAFTIAMAASHEFAGDAVRRRSDVLQDVAARAAATITQLPREEAAPVARALMSFENRFLSKTPADRKQRVSDFVAQWRGTDAALLTEVDVVSMENLGLQRLEKLETFARAHPRTEAAAKATYLRGFDLAHNALSLGIEQRGGDPIKRFLQVRDIVTELETGGYPRCEWVDKAPQLIVEFYAFEPKYSDDSSRIITEAYQEFARTHFVLDPNHPTRSGVGYIVTNKIEKLYRDASEGVRVVDRVLDALAADPAIEADVRYLRGLSYYLDRARGGRSEETRRQFIERARTAFKELYSGNTGLRQQRALAHLAVLEQGERNFRIAAQYLTEYTQKYPSSPWTWVAALRWGKALEAQGDWTGASKVYAEAAARYASNPVAVTLANAYAGQAYAALSRFDRAIEYSEQALKRWDDDYGREYSIYLIREPRIGETFTGIPKDETVVSKADLSVRTAESKQTLRAPGGALLEQARWQLEHDQRDAAIDGLTRLGKGGRSTIARDANELRQRAMMDRALDRGSFDELKDVERGPYSFWVCASKITRASRMWREGATADAEALMKEALDEWHRHQASAPAAAPAARLERDLLEIRNLVFKPRGDGPFAGTRWELQSLAPPKTPFLVVNPMVRIVLSTQEELQVRVGQPFPDFPNVLFMDADQLAFFDRLLAKVGGTKVRVPTAVMEVPNQPVGGSAEILKLLQQFFPARPGHWGGWMLQSFPIITAIEFLNESRTRAGVHVTIGYEGATLILEKNDGVWTFKEMVGRWIT